MPSTVDHSWETLWDRTQQYPLQCMYFVLFIYSFPFSSIFVVRVSTCSNALGSIAFLEHLHVHYWDALFPLTLGKPTLLIMCVPLWIWNMIFFRVQCAGRNEDSISTTREEGGVADNHEKQEGIWIRVVKTFIWFPSLIYYCTICFVCGLLTAFHWSFFYWFLESVQGKDTLLMGMHIAW